MTPTEFKAKYRTAIAPQLDKVKHPGPELLKAIIDLERMVSELKDCDCPPAPLEAHLPKPPDWFKDPPKPIWRPFYDFPPLVPRSVVVG